MSDNDDSRSRRWRILDRKSIAFLVGCIATLSCAVWLVLAWSSFTVSDARVVADVITVRSQVDGVVTEVPAEEGRFYEKGALLVALDDHLPAELVAEKEAKLLALRSSSEKLRIDAESATRTADIAVQDAEFGVRNAKIEALASDVRLTQMRNASNRSEQLAKDGLVSQESVEKDRDSFELARLEAEQAAAAEARRINALRRARLTELEARSAAQAVEVAKNTVQEAASELETAKLRLSWSRIEAPQDGIVGKLFVRRGDSVVEGQRLLLQFDPQTLRVEARVSERNLAHFEVGKRVWVSLDAVAGKKFPGVVKAVGAVARSVTSEWPQEPGQGNFVRVAQKVTVQIAISADGVRLIPGTLAKVTMDRR